jgi:hypothetical protein
LVGIIGRVGAWVGCVDEDVGAVDVGAVGVGAVDVDTVDVDTMEPWTWVLGEGAFCWSFIP